MADQPHSVTVESPKYNGIAVDNPTMVAYAKNLARMSKPTEYIAKVIGLPYSVVRKLQAEVAQEPDLQSKKERLLKTQLERDAHIRK